MQAVPKVMQILLLYQDTDHTETEERCGHTKILSQWDTLSTFYMVKFHLTHHFSFSKCCDNCGRTLLLSSCHLLQPPSMFALLSLPETRGNMSTLCLCGSSSPILRATSLHSFQPPCQQYVLMPTQGYFIFWPLAFHFAKSTFLNCMQHKHWNL